MDNQIKNHKNGLLMIFILLLGLIQACAHRQTEPELEPLSIDVRLEQAETLLNQHQYVRLQSLVSGVLAEDGDNPEAIALMAMVLLHDGEFVQAEQLLNKSPDLSHPFILEVKGLLLLAQGEFELALDWFTDLTKHNPNRWRSWDGLGVAQDLLGEHQLAQASYEHALLADGPEEKIQNNLGYSHLLADDLQAAQQILFRVLARYPEAQRVRANLALVLARTGQYEQAIHHWQHLYSDAQALNNAGYVAMLQGDFSLAQRYFERALVASPRFYATAERNLDRLTEFQSASY